MTCKGLMDHCGLQWKRPSTWTDPMTTPAANRLATESYNKHNPLRQDQLRWSKCRWRQLRLMKKECKIASPSTELHCRPRQNLQCDSFYTRKTNQTNQSRNQTTGTEKAEDKQLQMNSVLRRASRNSIALWNVWAKAVSFGTKCTGTVTHQRKVRWSCLRPLLYTSLLAIGIEWGRLMQCDTDVDDYTCTEKGKYKVAETAWTIVMSRNKYRSFVND